MLTVDALPELYENIYSLFTVKITVKRWQPIVMRFTRNFTVMFLQ